MTLTTCSDILYFQVLLLGQVAEHREDTEAGEDTRDAVDYGDEDGVSATGHHWDKGGITTTLSAL